MLRFRSVCIWTTCKTICDIRLSHLVRIVILDGVLGEVGDDLVALSKGLETKSERRNVTRVVTDPGEMHGH